MLQHLESALHIGGYQSFDVARNGSVTYTTQTSKYDRIQGVLARLLEETGSRTLADVGCNNGLVSFLAHRLGFSEVYALDHDKPAIDVVRTISRLSVPCPSTLETLTLEKRPSLKLTSSSWVP